MGKNVVIIAFFLLYISNFHIVNYYIDPSTWDGYYDNTILRHKFYEIMFFLFTLSTLLKSNKWTGTIGIFVMVFVSGSIIDKVFNGIYSIHVSDIFLTGTAIVIAECYHCIRLNILRTPRDTLSA